MRTRLFSGLRSAQLALRRGIVQLRGRPHLAGSGAPTFPERLQGPRENFPVTIRASEVGITSRATAAECARAARGGFAETLLRAGAVLFRGFPLRSARDFGDFHTGLGDYRLLAYVGGAAKRQKVEDAAHVYTASEEPPDYTVCLHNEMACLPTWPKLVLFFCEVPAAAACGGESVVADNREILPRLDGAVRAELERRGLTYHYNWSSRSIGFNRTWAEVFQTPSRGEVEAILRGSCDGFRWEEDDSLSYWNSKPATVTQPDTGEKIWFNQATRKHASVWTCHPKWQHVKVPATRMPTHSYYGDGSEIPDDVIQHIRDVSWQCAIGFQMELGDVLVMENTLVQHARMSFTGKEEF